MSDNAKQILRGNGQSEIRTGVFICHCGGNISDVVEVERVAAEISRLPNVVHSTTYKFMCSDPGQASIVQAVADHRLNRIIVAACSPTLHEATFRRVLDRAGLNPYLFEMVNIREQVSWVIKDREAATQKAIRLIRASVSRVRYLVELEKRNIPIHDSVLVIGGGVAGLTSALNLAKKGIMVTLMEKSGVLGGRMLELNRVFPTDERASDLIMPLVREVESNPLITVYKNADLKDSTGFIGDFNTTLSVKKADGTTGEVSVKSGVIIIAVGLDVYQPRQGEYEFGKSPSITGLLDFQNILNPDGPTKGKLEVNGKPVKNIGFIHCVGSRQWAGIHQPQADGKINDYCSRYCCTAILHSALEVRENFPKVNVFDFHEDIRTYGRGHEEIYEKACDNGVIFLRFNPKDPPKVEKDTKGPGYVIRVKDRLTRNEEIEVPVDMIVLGTGLQASDMSTLIDLYRCSRGPDRFLLEAHPKLRPVELAAFGLFLAGTVQGPMDITETTAAAAAAASKAAALVSKGFIELDPFIAEVNEELCTGCQTCLTVCPFDAIKRDDEKSVAVINSALCTGCGTCAATCPSNAIQQYGFNDDEVISEVLALLGVIQDASIKEEALVAN